MGWKNPRHKQLYIEPKGSGTVFGFTLTGSSQCYVTDGWLVTHNSGKTLVSTALGATYGRPTCALDYGAMRNKFVGSSEERIRAVMKTLKAIGKGDVLILATCNKLEALPPELKRRFRCGVWFFDLPTPAERERIWDIQFKRFELSPQQAASRALIDDTNWTGAEIRNVCELAWQFNSDLPSAAKYIVPVWRQDPASIDRLRKIADGSFLSANHEGTYVYPGPIAEQVERDREARRSQGGEAAPTRKIRVRES